MTLKNIKDKIYSLLDIEISEHSASENIYKDTEAKINSLIDSVGRKLAVYTKRIKKKCSLVFGYGDGEISAVLPADFAAFFYIEKDRKVYGREAFEIIEGKIYGRGISCGTYTLVYYSCPPVLNKNSDENTELYDDTYFGDIVAYGVAAELCADIYPSDLRRYMRLATEYDERLLNIMTSAGETGKVANGFFGSARGVI